MAATGRHRRATSGWPLVIAWGLLALSIAQVQAQDKKPPGASDSTHVVRPGDTLWDLSRRYMNTPIRWPELQRDNDVPAPRRMRPGQVLSLGSLAAVLDVNGDVFLNRGAGIQQPLAAGTTLEPGDVMVTGRNGFLSIRFVDGSKAVIPSNSTVRLLAAHGRSTRLELLNGRMESQVEKQKERDFEIRTRTFALGVKGTHFRARAENDQTTLEVLEGLVVATELDGEHRSLEARAGEGAPFSRDAPLATRPLLPAPQQHPTLERRVVAAGAVDGAVSYQLQLARDPGFLQLVTESRTAEPRFELAGDLAPGFYHTRLSAFDAQRVEGMAGSGLVFAPRAAEPDESVVRPLPDGSFEIRWTPRRDGRHTFELARTPEFSALLVSESGNYPGGVTVGPLEAPARYYWRCREQAEGESALQSAWGGSFEVPSR
ncbi:FecR domain-containing protein [Variovorax paradoxus]|nr:FecR domain-containing protein [Variovorax paradoxus]